MQAQPQEESWVHAARAAVAGLIVVGVLASGLLSFNYYRSACQSIERDSTGAWVLENLPNAATMVGGEYAFVQQWADAPTRAAFTVGFEAALWQRVIEEWGICSTVALLLGQMIRPR